MNIWQEEHRWGSVGSLHQGIDACWHRDGLLTVSWVDTPGMLHLFEFLTSPASSGTHSPQCLEMTYHLCSLYWSPQLTWLQLGSAGVKYSAHTVSVGTVWLMMTAAPLVFPTMLPAPLYIYPRNNLGSKMKNLISNSLTSDAHVTLSKLHHILCNLSTCWIKVAQKQVHPCINPADHIHNCLYPFHKTEFGNICLTMTSVTLAFLCDTFLQCL